MLCLQIVNFFFASFYKLVVGCFFVLTCFTLDANHGPVNDFMLLLLSESGYEEVSLLRLLLCDCSNSDFCHFSVLIVLVTRLPLCVLCFQLE